jgi:hypothetical protein
MGGIVGYDHEHEYSKDRSLYLINRAFDDMNPAALDDNVAAVISMCMYEVCSDQEPSFGYKARQKNETSVRPIIGYYPRKQLWIIFTEDNFFHWLLRRILYP